MIIYATKKMLDRYKLNTPDEMISEISPLAKKLREIEKDNSLYEWGCKLFYFDGKKCLELMHFETKFVVFLINYKVGNIDNTMNDVFNYIFDMYSSDKEMVKALKKYVKSSTVFIFDKITNRSIISSLNHVQSDWAWGGSRFYNYIKDGILHTKKINRDVNDFITTIKINNKSKYIVPYEYFAKVMKEKFK